MTPRLQLLFLALAISMCVSAAIAQDAKHESQLRSVRGVVADKSSDDPVPSAVVFLRNTRTNAVRSYIANEEGEYRFSGLDPNVDYEVHAEKDGAKSATRTVSSFDNKKDLVVNLKIEKRKADLVGP
jgi:Carboxypeptidase regulatory-like domain